MKLDCKQEEPLKEEIGGKSKPLQNCADVLRSKT